MPWRRRKDNLNKLNLKEATKLSVVENLESLDINITENNFDLGKLIIPNLTISSSAYDKTVKMPFSLLNNLEDLLYMI